MLKPSRLYKYHSLQVITLTYLNMLGIVQVMAAAVQSVQNLITEFYIYL